MNVYLRHTLAALYYRFFKSVNGCDAGFADFEAGNGVRTPHRIVCHIIHILLWVRGYLEDVERKFAEPIPIELQIDVATVRSILRGIDHALTKTELSEETAHRLLQGPLADILTHVGQLTMLRRLYGDILPSENYSRADVVAGKFNRGLDERGEQLLRLLGDLMSEISEQCLSAGWGGENEYFVPEIVRRVLTTGKTHYWGHGRISFAIAETMQAIATELGCWAVDDLESVGYDPYNPFPFPEGLEQYLNLKQEGQTRRDISKRVYNRLIKTPVGKEFLGGRDFEF